MSARPARAREQEACHGPSLGRSSRIRLRGRWTTGASFGTGSSALRTERLMPSQASLDGRATATSEQLAAPPDEEQRAFEAPKNRLQKLRPKPILWASKKLSRSAARPVVAPCAPRARSVETGAAPKLRSRDHTGGSDPHRQGNAPDNRVQVPLGTLLAGNQVPRAVETLRSQHMASDCGRRIQGDLGLRAVLTCTLPGRRQRVAEQHQSLSARQRLSACSACR